MSVGSMLKYAHKGSPILFFEDGVYCAMAGTAVSEKMSEVLNDHPLYVLKEDLTARGIDNIIDGITQVDYAGFVDLVEQHKTASWS
jgi:tRNA 2-thiouridine synthesizing protein B